MRVFRAVLGRTVPVAGVRISGLPPVGKVITGVPQAMDSMFTVG